MQTSSRHQIARLMPFAACAAPIFASYRKMTE
jgi:hypothetical protein